MSDTHKFSVDRQIERRLDQYRDDYWFQGWTAEELWQWQVQRRQRLRRVMRLDLPTVYAPPRVETLDSQKREGILQELVALETEEDFWVPLYLLKPLGQKSGGTIIALHGEGRGADDVVGLADHETARQHIQARQYDYAFQWAKAGFTVAAPELRGYGRLMLESDRRRVEEDPEEELWRNSVARLRVVYLRLGLTYAGCCVTDLMRLLDHLESRADVDPDRIGIAGVSEGARVLSWLIAVEDRIAAAAASALRRDDADTLLEPRLLPPALLDTRVLTDHVAIFSLFVAKPLCIQAGRADQDTPVGQIESAAERLGDLYGLCDARDRFRVDIHKGGRVLQQEPIAEFFQQWL